MKLNEIRHLVQSANGVTWTHQPKHGSPILVTVKFSKMRYVNIADNALDADLNNKSDCSVLARACWRIRDENEKIIGTLTRETPLDGQGI